MYITNPSNALKASAKLYIKHELKLDFTDITDVRTVNRDDYGRISRVRMQFKVTRDQAEKDLRAKYPTYSEMFIQNMLGDYRVYAYDHELDQTEFLLWCAIYSDTIKFLLESKDENVNEG